MENVVQYDHKLIIFIMQHFLVNQDISGDHAIVSDEELLHQMKTVLRFEKGNEFILLDGVGGKAQGIIENIDKRAIIVKLENYKKSEAPKSSLILYVAISKKPATFELILQKATELGVSEIIPLITERCQLREIRNEKRLLYIIKEATEQSERLFVPTLQKVMKWNDFIKNKPVGEILAGDARMHDLKLSEIKFKEKENINLIVGPEGGLTEKELQDIHKIGGKIFLLGNTVLRMETAAIAAMSIISCK